MNRIWSFVLTTALLTVAALPVYGQTSDCKNPNQKTYNKKPAFCAPDGTRGAGVSLVVNDEAIAIPDVRCSCLPIALRYNNPGVLKTPQGGWKTQMRDSAGELIADAKGHALFGSVEDGIAAWGEWMKRQIDKGQFTTAFQIMSLYAPPDDCVGSVGKPPNCPYGINPTLEYAERVASAVNKGANEELNLDGADAGGREALYAVFSAIATFEIGSDFCKSKCKISRELFEKQWTLFGELLPRRLHLCSIVQRCVERSSTLRRQIKDIPDWGIQVYAALLDFMVQPWMNAVEVA